MTPATAEMDPAPYKTDESRYLTLIWQSGPDEMELSVHLNETALWLKRIKTRNAEFLEIRLSQDADVITIHGKNLYQVQKRIRSECGLTLREGARARSDDSPHVYSISLRSQQSTVPTKQIEAGGEAVG